MTPEQLSQCTGSSLANALLYLPQFELAWEDFGVNTPKRQAAFLAQVGHESGGLRYVREIWGPTEAQMWYEGRKDLGNTEPGDGFKYRGRGLIQITGRANYAEVGEALATDFIDNPELLEEPDMAVRSAMWFWQKHGLNELADVGDFSRITIRINGGTNGLADRQALYAVAKNTLSA